jgi:hypothetical protein
MDYAEKNQHGLGDVQPASFFALQFKLLRINILVPGTPR